MKKSILVSALAITTFTAMAGESESPKLLPELHDASANAAVDLLGKPTRRHAQDTGAIYEWVIKPSQSTNLDCRVSIATDANENILHVRTSGAKPACETFVDRLKRSSRPVADAGSSQ